MSYFKAQPAKPIRRPLVKKVTLVQSVVLAVLSALAMIDSPYTGLSVLLGGLISILAQSFFSYRALRDFGSPDAMRPVFGALQAMYGKWLIIIAASILVLAQIEELNAGVFFVSLFVVHTLGAFLLPVLVKRET